MSRIVLAGDRERVGGTTAERIVYSCRLSKESYGRDTDRKQHVFHSRLPAVNTPEAAGASSAVPPSGGGSGSSDRKPLAEAYLESHDDTHRHDIGLGLAGRRWQLRCCRHCLLRPADRGSYRLSHRPVMLLRALLDGHETEVAGPAWAGQRALRHPVDRYGELGELSRAASAQHWCLLAGV